LLDILKENKKEDRDEDKTLYQLGETRDRELNGGQKYWPKIKIQD
jgi:hypothetical protein